MDANKTKNSQKSQLAMKNFGKIVDFVEQMSCRHLLFSNYFGDSKKPECKAMCDVCKDRKGAEKTLDMFHRLSMNHYSGAVEDGDGSDLYGGRWLDCL